MWSIIVFFVLLCSGSILGVVRWSRKFSDMLPISCGVIILTLFLFGLAGQLLLGFYFLLLAGGALFAYSGIYAARMKTVKQSLQRLLQADFFMFFAGAAFFLFGDFGMKAIGIDDFTHWMDIVKVMAWLDDFGTNPSANSYFASYPPGIALFQYVLQKLHLILDRGSFSEWRAIFAYKILTLSMIAPLFRKARFQYVWGMLLTWFAAIILPGLFLWSFYVSTMSDSFLGVMSGIGLSYILLYQYDERMQCLSVCTAAAILVLTKDSGLFFSITLLTAYFFTKITEKSSSEAKYQSIFPDLGLALISVALPKILWNLHLKQKGTALVFREPVTLPELAQILMQKDETWKQVCWNSYFPKLISNDVKMGWYLKIRTSYFVWTLICIAIGLLLLFLIKKRESSSKQVAVGKIILIAAVIQLIVYVIGIAFAYVTQFEEPEAIDHAAMTRYIGVVFLGLVVVLFSLATEVFAKESYKHAIGTILCAILVFQMCPWGILKRYATRMYVEESITERREYEQLAEELHAITPEGKAWLIVQQDSGAVYHIVKFSVRPVQVQTGQWSLSGDPKSDEWMDQLCESYDAVVVFRTDDEFVDQYGELFDNPGSVEDRSIYIVDPEKRKLVCISS